LALPAAASTLPRVDMKRGETAVAAGFFDFCLDRAIGDRASLGLGYTWVGSHVAFARGVYRLAGEVDGPTFGLTFAAGTAPYPYWSDMSDTSLGDITTPAQLFFQPAVVWAVPFWNFRFRATLGPTIFSRVRVQQSFRYMENEIFPIVPDFELAYNFGRGEITLGGNAVVAARLIF
ncbi:MAG: hypothetical protein JWM80_1058, partial [Cyanobacteria bacterium RYN_339]|nr:hypothetical protein [Cyanobacteria bacterium RYN_339]